MQKISKDLFNFHIKAVAKGSDRQLLWLQAWGWAPRFKCVATRYAVSLVPLFVYKLIK